MLTTTDATTIEARLTKCANTSTEMLKKSLAEKLSLTADSLMECACIIRTLEERGEDLSELRLGIIPMLRKIAHGQLLPELVAKYAGNGNLLRRISNLPVPDQQSLLKGASMKVMLVDSQGTDHRLVEPHKMTIKEICQVFAPDHIRDDGEQVSWIRSRPTPRLPAGEQDIVIDKRRGGVSINGRFVSRSELASLLSRVVE